MFQHELTTTPFLVHEPVFILEQMTESVFEAIL